MANQNEQRDVLVTVNNGQAMRSIKELESASRRLRQEWRKATNANDQAIAAKKLKNVNTELRKLRAETRPAASGLNKVLGNLQKLMTVAAAFVGFQVITDAFRNMISRGAELSDVLANVRRTTGLTDEEVRKLDKDLRKLDTRSSRKELLGLAEQAGRLGIKGVKNVRDFVEEADKINVALGDELGEDAILQLGKLADSFDTNMTRIGSSINTVGSETKAQEGYLVEFAARVQGSSVAAKLAIPDVIGYGAALDSVGLKVEASGTALNNFLIDFVKNTEEFGEVAGFAKGELSELIGTEGTNAGFIAFLEKLKEANPESDKFLAKLEELGINGARGSQVFLALSNNLNLVKDSQQLANDAFNEGTSILDEFNMKNENFAANVNRVTRELQRWFMNSALMDGVESFFGSIADYMKVPMSAKLRDEQSEMNALVGAIELASDNQQLRNDLLDELMTLYPKYFSNLDKEKTTNQDLKKILEEVNQLYQERIKLAVLQEELQEIEERGLELAKKQREYIKDQEFQKKLAFIKKLAKTEAEGLEEVYDASIKLYREGISADEQKALGNFNYSQTLQDVLNGLKAQKDLEAAINANVAERAELMGEISTQKVKAGETDAGSGVATGTTGLDLSGAPSKAQKKKAEAWQKKLKKFQEEYLQLQLDAIRETEQQKISSLAKEYQANKARITAEVEDEDLKQEMLRQLYINFENDKDEIHAIATEERIKAEAQKVQAANESELFTLQLKVDTTDEGTAEGLEARIAQLWKFAEIEYSTMQLSNEQKLLLQEEYEQRAEEIRQRFRDIKNEKDDEQSEIEKERAEDTLSYLSDMFGQLFDLIQQGYDNQIKADDVRRDKAISNVEKEYENGKLSKEQYEAKKNRINEKYDKKERDLKRKAFEASKAAQITNAVISTAQAAIAAYSSAAAVPIAGIALGPAMAAVAAAFGAVQIGLIAAEPNPYYKGGYTDVTDTEGTRHHAKMVGSFADGGYFSNASYGVVGERGTELVVPNNVLNNPDYSDSIAHIESAIYRKNSSSGKRSDSTAIASKTSSSNEQSLIHHNKAMQSSLDRNTEMMEKLMREGIKSKAVWEWDEFYTGIIDQETIDGRNYFSSNGNRNPGTE